MKGEKSLPKVTNWPNKSKPKQASCSYSFPVDLEFFILVLKYKDKFLTPLKKTVMHSIYSLSYSIFKIPMFI